MKFLVGVLVGVLHVCAGAGNDAEASRYVSASGGLKLVERSDGAKGHYANWKGQLELTGVLVVEFQRAMPGESSPKPGLGIVFFEPDSASLGKLPAAVGKFYPGQPKSIWVENAEPVPILSSLLGAERAALARDSTVPRYEVPVRLQLSEFGTSIDCDHRNFGLTYTKIVLRTDTLVAMAEAKHFGC